MSKGLSFVICLLGISLLLGACTSSSGQLPTPAPAAASPSSSAVGALKPPVPAPTLSGANKIDELYEAAKKDGEVVWQTVRAADSFQPVVDAFQRRFPGVKMTVITVIGPVLAQRVLSEAQAKRITIDVGTSVMHLALPMLDRDLLVAQDYAGTGVDPKAVTLDGKALFVSDVGVGVFYNTQMVSATDAPRRWEDLLDPKWEGKFAVHPAGAAWDGLSSIWDDARLKTFLQDLSRQKPVVPTTGADATARLARGEVAISNAPTMDQVAKARNEGAPLDMAPLDPLHSGPLYTFMIKGGPHPSAAKLLMAWFGSDEGRRAFAASDWGPLQPCGPTSVDKFLCGRQFQMYRIDTLEKARKALQVADLALESLGLKR